MEKSKVINLLKNIFLDLIIVLLICSLLFSFINKKKPVPIFGYYLFNVLSGSMQDTLKVGDNIIVKETNDYSIGDIITYKKNNIYVTHRIVKIEDDMITTRGDSNTADDEPFNKNDILGEYVYKSDLLNFIIDCRILIVLTIVSCIFIKYILKAVGK